MKKNNYSSKIICISLVFVVILMSFLVIFGQDYHFHLNRLGAMVDELRINPFNIPIRIYGNAFNGYGYGVPLFYGDLLLYLPAYLSLFGLKLINSYKMIIIAIFLLSFVSMYYSMRITIRSKNTALVAAGLYVFSPYFLIDLCIRQALGEAQALIFVPIVILSFYRMINGSKRKEYLYMSLGMLGIVLSHNITFVLIIFILLVWFFVEHKKTFNKKIISNLLKASLITTLLSSSFVFPMIEAIVSQDFHYQIEGTMAKEEFIKYVISFEDLLMPDEIIRGLYAFFGIGEAERVWEPGAIGLNFIMLIGLCIFRKKNISNNFMKLLCIVIFVYSFLMIKPLINFAGNYLSFMQFPWRLLIIPTFIIPILLSIMLEKEKYKNTLLIILIACGLFSVLPRYAYQAYIQLKGKEFAITLNENYAEDYTFEYNNNNFDYLYIPKECSTHLYENRPNIARSKSREIPIERENNIISLNLDNYILSEEIELPLYYYKGYVAKSNNNILKIDKSEKGLLLVSPSESCKKIVIYYEGTKIQRISDCISFISLLVLLVIVIKNKKENDYI